LIVVVRRIKMNKIRFSSIGWLIGYFVVFAPLNLALHQTSLIYALIHSIIGVGIACLIEVMSR